MPPRKAIPTPGIDIFPIWTPPPRQSLEWWPHGQTYHLGKHAKPRWTKLPVDPFQRWFCEKHSIDENTPIYIEGHKIWDIAHILGFSIVQSDYAKKILAELDASFSPGSARGYFTNSAEDLKCSFEAHTEKDDEVGLPETDHEDCDSNRTEFPLPDDFYIFFRTPEDIRANSDPTSEEGAAKARARYHSHAITRSIDYQINPQNPLWHPTWPCWRCSIRIDQWDSPHLEKFRDYALTLKKSRRHAFSDQYMIVRWGTEESPNDRLCYINTFATRAIKGVSKATAGNKCANEFFGRTPYGEDQHTPCGTTYGQLPIFRELGVGDLSLAIRPMWPYIGSEEEFRAKGRAGLTINERIRKQALVQEDQPPDEEDPGVGASSSAA